MSEEKTLNEDELAAVTGGVDDGCTVTYRSAHYILGHLGFVCPCPGSALLVVEGLDSVTCPKCGRVWRKIADKEYSCE